MDWDCEKNYMNIRRERSYPNHYLLRIQTCKGVPNGIRMGDKIEVQKLEQDGRTNSWRKKNQWAWKQMQIGAWSVWHTCWRRMAADWATNTHRGTYWAIARQLQAVVFMNQGLLGCSTLRCFNTSWHLIHEITALVVCLFVCLFVCVCLWLWSV